MMGISGYRTKKELRTDGIGRFPRFIETSLFGNEYDGEDGDYVVVGPDPYVRNWFAKVTVRDGRIVKVS